MTDSNKPALGAQSEDEEPSMDIPGVDTEKGLSFYAYDLDIYLDILRSFAANTPPVLDRIRSVSPETLADYAISLHGIKGISANVCAENTRAAALELETMARAGDLPGVLAKNAGFIKDTEAVLSAIKAWLEQYDAAYNSR